MHTHALPSLAVAPPLPCPTSRRAWSVDDYLAAPRAVRNDLRARYAAALAAHAALPPSPDLKWKMKPKDRPSFIDPSGFPLSGPLAAHLEWEIEVFG